MSSLASGNWHWQSGIKRMSEGMRYIHENGEFTDCEFHVGQQKFKAHRLVLAARSPVFDTLLMKSNAPYENLVEAESVTETGFKILLDFIYTDEIGTNDKSSIVEAFAAAAYYQQPILKRRCEEMINAWNISEDEVCNLLNVSLTVPVLQERCVNFIENNSLKVISSPGFLDLKMESLKTLLERNCFKIKDVELMLRIERIMKWGEKRYEANHTTPVNYTKVREDFLTGEPPLLKMIGLEQLGLDQFNRLFAVRGRYNGLITREERVHFMDYFEDNNKKNLPEWMN